MNNANNTETKKTVAANMVERYTRRAQLADNSTDRTYWRNMAKAAAELAQG